MFNKEMAKNDSIETIIGSSVTLDGNFNGNGDIIIEGMVNGTLNTSGVVTIGQNARVKAEVRAQSLSIAGEVKGNIESTERVDLLDTAKVIGNIKCKILQIAAGAVFHGKSSMNDAHGEIKTDAKSKKENL